MNRIRHVAALAALVVAFPQVGDCYATNGNIDGAVDSSSWNPIVQFPNAASFAEFTHFSDALKLNDLRGALSALTRIARRWPTVLKAVDDDTIKYVIDENYGKPASRRAALDAIEALHDVNWTPKADSGFDYELYRLAIDLEARGEADKAQEVAWLIEQPYSVLRMRVDHRFDADADLDPAAALETGVARRVAEMAKAPKSLSKLIGYVVALRAEGDDQVALAAADAAILKAHDPKAFDDQKDEYPDLLASRGRILDRLGRQLEAIDQLSAAVKAAQPGGPDVVAKIDLAYELEDVGRPREALGAVADIAAGDLSTAGRLIVEQLRACADVQLNDTGALAKSMAALSAAAGEHPGQWLQALWCAGEPDPAAAGLIAALQDPLARGDALAFIQTYRLPANPTDLDLRLKAFTQTMLARPDVRAAVDQAGRVMTWPFESPDD